MIHFSPEAQILFITLGGLAVCIEAAAFMLRATVQSGIVEPTPERMPPIF